MKILSVKDPAFRKYGRVITNVNFTELVEEMKKTVDAEKEKEKEKKTNEQQALRGLTLDRSTLIGLLPLFEELVPGMTGSRRELEV